MKIYETEKPLPSVELERVCNDLQKAIPSVYFTDWINSPFGRITGWSHHKWRPDCGRLIVVYYHHGVAVINETLKNKEETINALQKLGYHVPSQQMNLSFLVERKYDGKKRIRAEDILWDELRKGRGLDLIKRNLEALLKPLLLLQGEKIDQYEFAVYSPGMVFSSDDICPPYWEYDEIFRLPTLSNGMVNLDLLLEKIKQMPDDRAIAVSSRVRTPDGEKHIPLIDFSSRYGSGVWDPSEVLERLQVPQRVLVDSGNSMHHYNLQNLLTFESFINYMENLAKQPEIGKNWPYLQAFQQFGLLRITPCGSLKPDFPEIDEDIS